MPFPLQPYCDLLRFKTKSYTTNAKDRNKAAPIEIPSKDFATKDIWHFAYNSTLCYLVRAVKAAIVNLKNTIAPLLAGHTEKRKKNSRQSEPTSSLARGIFKDLKLIRFG